MAHTFRDGAYSQMFYDSAGVCFSSALGKKFAKKVSRKKQRRQLHAIEKQAVQEFYVDRTLELLEEELRYSNDFYEYEWCIEDYRDDWEHEPAEELYDYGFEEWIWEEQPHENRHDYMGDPEYRLWPEKQERMQWT